MIRPTRRGAGQHVVVFTGARLDHLTRVRLAERGGATVAAVKAKETYRIAVASERQDGPGEFVFEWHITDEAALAR